MKITRISDTVCQLTFLGISNCYLLRESDGFTLIDTSIKGRETGIFSAARQFGGTIKRILLTHAHGDHMGSLDGLHHALGNPDVAISEREAPLLHKDLSLRSGEPQGKPKRGYPGAKTKPTHLLTEGELFGSLRCISTPGRTPGHMAFLDERDGTIFAGDGLVSIGGLRSVTNPPWYFPLPKLATWNMPLALQSARKLASLRPASVATGHGAFTPNAPDPLERAIAEAEAKA